MTKTLLALALLGALGATALPALADSGPPPLPELTAEQRANLDQELSRYRGDVEDRVTRGELSRDEADRLVQWRRWQLARQIAGVAPQQPQVIVREYVAPPPPYGYDPWYRPYYWGPPVYYGPRVSVCAGGFGRHSFGSVCF